MLQRVQRGEDSARPTTVARSGQAWLHLHFPPLEEQESTPSAHTDRRYPDISATGHATQHGFCSLLSRA